MVNALNDFFVDLTGLLTDDLGEDDLTGPVRQEAIRRLPEVLINERMFRITRAMDLNVKKTILPQEEWIKFEEASIHLLMYFNLTLLSVQMWYFMFL